MGVASIYSAGQELKSKSTEWQIVSLSTLVFIVLGFKDTSTLVGQFVSSVYTVPFGMCPHHLVRYVCPYI